MPFESGNEGTNIMCRQRGGQQLPGPTVLPNSHAVLRSRMQGLKLKLKPELESR